MLFFFFLSLIGVKKISMKILALGDATFCERSASHRVNWDKKPTRLKIHPNELTEEWRWAGYLREIVARLKDLKRSHQSLCPPILQRREGNQQLHCSKTHLRHQTRPVSSILMGLQSFTVFSFFLLNHEDSDPSLGSHSTANTQRQSLVPHTLTAIKETGTGLTIQSYSPELEAKYADSQTNTDLWPPSDWLASPMGTYEEFSAFGRAA